MVRYQRNFRKVVWGFVEVDANSPEQAQKRFDDGLYDEFDNKDDTEYEGDWEAQED
jgi:hypothetical protein